MRLWNIVIGTALYTTRVDTLRRLYKDQQAFVKIESETTDCWFTLLNGGNTIRMSDMSHFL